MKYKGYIIYKNIDKNILSPDFSNKNLVILKIIIIILKILLYTNGIIIILIFLLLKFIYLLIRLQTNFHLEHYQSQTINLLD